MDRLELEDQAKKALAQLVSADFQTMIYKENPYDYLAKWRPKQAAEKLAGTVILRSRRRRRISHCVENIQSEILRFAQDDSLEEFFRSLFSPALPATPKEFPSVVRNPG